MKQLTERTSYHGRLVLGLVAVTPLVFALSFTRR